MIRVIITADLLLIFCFDTVLGQFPDSAQGILRLTETSICADTCTTYYIDPDSGFAFHYINGDLDPYLGQHVRIYGASVWCVICGGLRVSRVEILSPAGSAPEIGALPKKPALLQNYPNPFNPVTTVTYSLPKGSQVRLKIYNVLGEEVADLVEGYVQPGIWSAEFDGSMLASGTYFCRLVANGFVEVKKMMLVK